MTFTTLFDYASSLERITFVRIPRIKAQATVVIVTFPKEIENPPTPVMRITEATKRFLFLFKSTLWNIFNPAVLV